MVSLQGIPCQRKDILDVKDMENHIHDLKEQNRKKNGGPFIILDRIVKILARFRAVFNASFRSLEPYIRIFKDIIGIPRISFTSIYRRIRGIKVPEIKNRYTSVGIDSTGFKTTNRSDWHSNKWSKKRKPWIKLHASADTERIMASRIYITVENNHDANQSSSLISGQETRVCADKAYHSKKTFNLFRNNGNEAIIPRSRNFRTISRGSHIRGKKARENRKLGEDQRKISM